jgi:hypothetical protein
MDELFEIEFNKLRSKYGVKKMYVVDTLGGKFPVTHWAVDHVTEHLEGPDSENWINLDEPGESLLFLISAECGVK